jgi:hypothetical protein
MHPYPRAESNPWRQPGVRSALRRAWRDIVRVSARWLSLTIQLSANKSGGAQKQSCEKRRLSDPPGVLQVPRRKKSFARYHLRMGLFDRFKKPNPPWFASVKDFCKGTGIEIAGWGPKTLVVIAKSPEKASEIAGQLASFGFKPVEDADDVYAGLLTLSRDDS